MEHNCAILTDILERQGQYLLREDRGENVVTEHSKRSRKQSQTLSCKCIFFRSLPDAPFLQESSSAHLSPFLRTARSCTFYCNYLLPFYYVCCAPRVLGNVTISQRQALVSRSGRKIGNTWKAFTEDLDGSVALGVANLLVSLLQGVSL